MATFSSNGPRHDGHRRVRWLTWRAPSRKHLEAQRRFEREKALTEHGRDKIDGAIAALRLLQRHNWETVAADLVSPNALDNEVRRRYDLLAETIPCITDLGARTDVEIVHAVIGSVWNIEHHTVLDSAPRIVWRACRAGLVTLGGYLRDEPWEESAAEAIQTDNDEQDEASWRKLMKEQAAAREVEKKRAAGKPAPDDGAERPT